MIFHAFFIFSVLVSAAVAGENATAAYVPTDVFLFNCGETSDQMDISGRNWMSEQRKILPSNAADASFPSRAPFQGSVVSQVPYMTARIFRQNFTYNIPVSPGWKFLRLYFYPTRYDSDLDLVNSYFSVTVNGFTLLKNFSADLTAKASNGASIVKEFIVPVTSGHTMLNLTFTPSLNMLAFVNGIEIVTSPDRFYSKGGFDGRITPVGNTIDVDIGNWTAFETVHRLNIGGQMIDGVNDTGMFRQWLAEEYLLSANSGVVPNTSDVKIMYTEKTPRYVAPEDVYKTSRTMGNVDNPRLNLNFNLTWLFPVDAGFNYLVRLHFCETLPEVNGPVQRVFTIFIGNKIAKIDMDVIYLSGGSRMPVYLDFNVVVGFENGPRPDLRLDLHPYKDVVPTFYDAILNGVEILKLNFSDGNLAGPNPSPNPNPTPGHTPNSVKQDRQKGKDNPHVLVIILGTVGFAIVLAMFVVAFVIVMKRRKSKKKVSVDTKSKPTDSWTTLPLVPGSSHTRSTTSLPSDLCRRFSILEIRSATNNFEKKLIVGVGGFGPVYKGRIDGGATLVAVKRLDISSNQGVTEFEAELKMLSMLRHIHLVSLVGYCDDENEMVLVYEYMPHGTLRDHLYKRNKVFDPPLSWKRRLEICIGAARGIQYLHTGAKEMIIHRDIKTTNILLDENYVAKVSDFGLSKVGLTSSSQTHVSTVVKGSFGYLDPEYYRRQVLTEKSDVYSFGVVLFEVLCCRPVRLENVTREETDLIRWVKSNYKKGTVDQIVDEDLTAEITPLSLEKFCEIAVRCVQDRGIERPSMNDVVWALEFALQLHEAAKSKSGVDSLQQLPRRDEVGTTTDGENDLFSRTTGRMSKSVTSDDDSARLAGDERSGSSWGVFSEIKDPKAR
ncbi:receptor-like protein kinase [Hirschfeldia incana]|nr:receptor-like protein kinase [Hirschfeldia incana]